MSSTEIATLIISGLLVGFINTLAGGGTIISISLLMFMGLPADIANGTNRIAVSIQTLSSVLSYKSMHVLDWRKGLKLGLPVIIGSILGALIAVEVDKTVIEKSFGVALIIMLYMVIMNPGKWLHGNKELVEKPLSLWQIVLFFVIGVYGGFLHVGVGYFLLAAILLGIGYDLVHANAIKVLIVLMYVPFTLAIFVLSGKVNWEYGLIHAVGNVVGAWIGARYAVKRGINAVRWVMGTVIVVSILQVFHIIDFKSIYESLN